MANPPSNVNPAIELALKAITPILFEANGRGQEPNEVDWDSQNASEVVNLQLKKAWINWILGDVDTIVEKINFGEIEGKHLHELIPHSDMSLNAKIFLTGQSSRNTAHTLAYKIEPKLHMIKDVQRSLDKLEYLANNKNDPDYKRCAFNLNTTLQYLMTDIQPQLEQFLNITDIDTGLAGLEEGLVKEYSSIHMKGGGHRRRRKSKKSKSKSKRKSKSKSKRKSKSSKGRKTTRRRGAGVGHVKQIPDVFATFPLHGPKRTRPRKRAVRRRRASPRVKRSRSSPYRRRSAKPVAELRW